MNRWRQQFMTHPMRDEMKKIEVLISNKTLITEDTEILESYNRVIIVINNFINYINNVIPENVEVDFWNKYNGILPQLRSGLEDFFNKNRGVSLNKVNDFVSALANTMPLVPVPNSTDGYIKALNEISSAVSTIIDNLNSKSKTTIAEYERINNLANNIDKRLEANDATIEKQKDRLDNAIASFQQQFSDSESERRKQAQETENSIKGSYENFQETAVLGVSTLIKDEKQRLNELQVDLNEKGDGIISEMEAKRDAAALVLNVSTNLAVSGSYGKYAWQEKITAEVFRVVALCFMIFLVYSAYRLMEIALHVDSLDWKLLSLRFVTTFTLAIPAYYAVHESSKHRAIEHKYRKMQLELAAVDPYLEDRKSVV